MSGIFSVIGAVLFAFFLLTILAAANSPTGGEGAGKIALVALVGSVGSFAISLLILIFGG